jgi:hypothetical protein
MVALGALVTSAYIGLPLVLAARAVLGALSNAAAVATAVLVLAAVGVGVVLARTTRPEHSG